ncbi:CocE/NonD family hydrolase [Solimonas terrae]|uniref:CocE/NonD family hydrolase n=1 Tax=Solimonas terrae TaxID=1396819 RepID=A0A6M2BQE1_9GAMM|nr:CocE/NonD family hydrolase [Solimonas terrae]NGY04668.1 CocE/NonD family hydrolase [Solimonas terrae]
MKMSPIKWLCLCVLMLLAMPASAQDRQVFGFKAPAGIDAPEVPAVMRDLAERVLPVYQDPDPDRYLATLSALQWADSNYKAAEETRETLRERESATDATGPGAGQALLFDVYARAKTIEATGSAGFAQAFTQSFHDVVGKLDDLAASAVTNALQASPPPFREAWQQALDRARGKDSIELPEATALIRAYFAYEANRELAPLAAALGADEDRRRYAVDDDVLIATPAGVPIHARVVRPKRGAAKLPTLLEFTLQLSPADARTSAAHGYVGVVAYTRGKLGGPKASLVPFRYDGVDARAVIRWIARQPWSDGRVGMYGSDYAGFAAWAATKNVPRELKTIVTADAIAPGISFPMEGHIFRNEALRWATDHAVPGAVIDDDRDDARWQALDRRWYASGKPYRDLAVLADLPRSVFRDWLHHPSYDHYWERTSPFRKQFAHIGIPVLSIGGYYAQGAVGTLYYYRQHLQYRPDADHVLLLGPYDDRALRDGPAPSLRGTAVSPAAQIDLLALRYQWFDHIFKGAARPALLPQRVNYQLMGTDEWRHVPSLQAMANGVLKIYPAGAAASSTAGAPVHTQTVDFADRSDTAIPVPPPLMPISLPADPGLLFESEALKQTTDVSGIVSGELDFVINKYDFDLRLTLYAQSVDGHYLQLADPYEFRASYARDDVDRHLLKAGIRQKLKFTSGQIGAMRLPAGSRVIGVLAVSKRPDRQLNYGAADDVSVESIAAARVPMEIRWYGDSHLDVPVRR